jgi:RND family efflux transporter MFP subunit
VAAEGPRSVRDELATLRIDRSQRGAAPRPPWQKAVALGAIALLFLLGSLLAWRATLGRTPRVEVAYARRTTPGANAGGAVLTGSGYVVTGDRYISLGARVPGRIEAYLVDEGEAVVAGQPLVRLDSRNYSAALAEARASLALARANLDLRRKEIARSEELHDRGVASQADLDLKQNQLRVAQAEVDRLAARIAQLEIDVEDTLLRAPTNGVVLEKLKEVGEIAVPGGFAGSGELIRLANMDELRAEVDVNEAELSKISLGQPAEVAPDAYAGKRYRASVVKLYPQINRQKGTLKVEVKILDPDAMLRPDMSARITFLRETPPQTAGEGEVLAPAAAIRSEAGASFVWVVTQGRLRRQAIETSGDAGSGQTIVSKGLAGGEALVIGEAAGLAEGSAVEVAPGPGS